MSLLGGIDPSGNNLEIDFLARLETVNASINLYAGAEGWIKGSLVAGGAGSDIILSADESLRVSGSLTASDLIQLSAGSLPMPHVRSVWLEPAATLAAGNLANGDAGRIQVYGVNDVYVDTSIHAPNSGSTIHLEATLGTLTLTHDSGIVTSGGYVFLGGGSVDLASQFNDTGHAASGDDVEIFALADVNLTASVTFSHRLHVVAGRDITLINTVTATESDGQVRMEAGRISR